MRYTALVVVGTVGLAACASHRAEVGYLSQPNRGADKVMVDDAVTALWPHCTTEDYGTIQLDSRLTGEFSEWLKAGMVQRGCNVLSVPPPNPAGTTILTFVVDSADDSLERRLTLIARGSTMSRLYSKTNGQWAAIGAWSVSAGTVRR